MKPPKPEPVTTQLDPSHPNYDALLLKRARLEQHRRRRRENRGEEASAGSTLGSRKSDTGKSSAAKSDRGKPKTPTTKSRKDR